MHVCMCMWNGVYGYPVAMSQGVIAAEEECFTLRSKVQSTKNTIGICGLVDSQCE